MPPHGPGMSGGDHSHCPEFPGDPWNLFSMLATSTTSLNTTVPGDTVGIFKPFERKMSADPHLISDTDREMIIVARFVSPVHIRRICIMGGVDAAGTGTHPSRVR